MLSNCRSSHLGVLYLLFYDRMIIYSLHAGLVALYIEFIELCLVASIVVNPEHGSCFFLRRDEGVNRPRVGFS